MSSAGTTVPGTMWRSSEQNPKYKTSASPRRDADGDGDIKPGIHRPLPKEDSSASTMFHGRAFNVKWSDRNPKLSLPRSTTVQPRTVRWSDKEPLTGRETVTTDLGGVLIHTAKPYEQVVAERDMLLGQDETYRKRINELENENAQILIDYDTLYKESNMLREKLEMGTEGEYIESYQRIFADREILREAEVAYKRRIEQLQREARDMVANFDSLYAENNVLRTKTRDLETKLDTIDRLDDIKKMNELEKKTKQQEKTIRTMGYERESTYKEKTEIESQNLILKGNVADTNKRNLMLERENEALKRGFMALGQTEENKWKDDTLLRRKTKREEEVEKQMQEDLKKYKTSSEKLANANKELQKNIIELETKNSMLDKDKNSLEDRLFTLTSEQVKRTPSAVKRREAANLEKNEQKMDDLLKQVNDLLIENTEIKVKCEMLNKDKLHLETKIKEVSSEKRETASSVRRKKETEKELEEHKKQVAILTEKVQQHNLVKSDLERNIKKLEDEIKSLSGTGKSLVQEQKEQTDQVKSLNKQIITLHEEIRKLTEENGKIKQESAKYTDDLEHKISLLEKDANSLVHEKQATERHVKSDESNYKSKLESLQQELELVQVDLRVTKPKLEDALAKVKQLKNKKEALKESLDSKTAEVTELQDIMRKDKDVFNELAKSERENAILKREIKDQDTSFEREKNKLNVELEELLKNQEFMTVSLAEHRVRLDLLQAEKLDVRTDNVRLIKVNERQKHQIRELTMEMQTMKETEQVVTKELKEEINTLTEKLRQSETTLIQCKQELDTMTNEKDNQVNKLIKQLQKVREERKLETKQLQDQSDSLRSEVGRLKVFEERIESVEQELKGFVKKLQESEKKTKKSSDQTFGTLGLVINEMKSENLANRIRAAEMEDNDIERHKLELEIKQDAINEIRKLKLENARLLQLLEDKSTEEDARSEWSKKRNKYNALVAQNKRLQEENKRVLLLYDQSEDESTRKDVRIKAERMRQIETKTASQAVEIGDLRRDIQEKEAEMKTLVKQTHDIATAQDKSKRLISENKELKEELSKKDAIVASLKDLELTKAKYHDISVNNQRLYIENQRLRENLDKSTDYKLEYKLAKASEQSLTAQQARSSEDRDKLKKELTAKIKEAHSEILLHKENITTLKDRNNILLEDNQRLKDDLGRKDDIILSLKEFETAREKFKQASANNKRLYDENVRLREILEQFAWNNDIEKAMQLSQAPNVKHLQKAVYIEGDTTLVESVIGHERVSDAEEIASLMPARRKDGKQKRTMSQPIPTLPVIGKDVDKMQGATGYPNIPAYIKGTPVEVITLQKEHRKTKEELVNATKELEKRSNDVRRLKEKNELLKSEVARLKRETEAKDSATENRFNRESNLEHHNRRLQTEVQRLRDELNIQTEEVAMVKVHTTSKTSRSMPDNSPSIHKDKRVTIQAKHSPDTVTREHDHKASTPRIKQLLPKRADQWATKVNSVPMNQQPTVTPRRATIPKGVNETDESKLTKSKSETKISKPDSPHMRDVNYRPVTKRKSLKTR